MHRLGCVIERTLVILLIAVIFTPLVASLPEFPPAFRALRNSLFATPKRKHSRSHSSSWTSANPEAFKKELADRVNTGFFGRDFLIRWTNELWYRAFRMCAAKSADIIVNKDGSLIQSVYLEEYCVTRVRMKDLEPLVLDLKRMQEVCEKLNIGFALLITPSKAAICPEAIAPEWIKRYDPRPRAYDCLVPLLKKHGIRFVDGHELALRAKPTAPAPVFPKGGIHWGQFAASRVTNALAEELKAQGKSVAPISYSLRVEKTGGIEERDLHNLMNLATPWRYPIAKLGIVPNPPEEGKRPSMAVIGGSFMWRVIQQLVASQQFSEINGYFYYKLFKTCNPDIENGSFRVVRKPTGELNFAREIYGADCLVLEVNEQAIPDATHLKTFLRDALANVPKDGERAPFRFESFQPYQWGQSLSFRASDLPEMEWPKLSLTGFAAMGEDATWTVGPMASVRLSVPATEHNLLLKAEVGAFIAPGKLPRQGVKIFANGVPAGEWQFTDSESTCREIVIQKEWLRKTGKLVLEFAIDRPTSPKSLKLSADTRNIGLKFSSLLISETEH